MPGKFSGLTAIIVVSAVVCFASFCHFAWQVISEVKPEKTFGLLYGAAFGSAAITAWFLRRRESRY